MTIVEATILGVLQGLTEFLPVSSSGHLAIFEALLGLEELPLLFDVLVHVGTLTAVFIYFRRDLTHFFKFHFTHLVIGTIPAIVVGLYIYQNLQSIFSDLYLVGLSYLITTLLLFLSVLIKKTGTTLEKTSKFQAFLIGIFQALAILPGVSRSGATIVGGRIAGLDKNAAFTFSFLLSAPAILGALTLTLTDLGTVDPNLFFPSLVGFLAAVLSGLLGLKILDFIFRQKNLLPFAIYTLIVGSLLLGLFS